MEYALKENELIPLTFDIMFTEIFNNPDNICILEEFISNYLDIPLKEVTGNLKILSRRLKKEVRYDSRKEVDLLLNYKGKKINIEMSNNKSDGVINRNVVYLCKIHGNQLKVGDTNYSKINSTIQIVFNNFNISNELKTTWYLRNDEGQILTSKLRIDIINLVKGHEKGYNEGHEKGIEQGIEQGIEKGIKQNNIDVAKKMLEEKLPLETISKITGLSIKEITELK